MKVAMLIFADSRQKIGHHTNVPWEIVKRRSDWSCSPICVPMLKIWRLVQYIPR